MKEKVFCIGLNRTGTKSFSKAMRTLGYSTLPWSPSAMMKYINGQYNELHQIVECFDCFDDWPWPLMARDLMGRYPRAKFVLTHRSSATVWLSSIKRHSIKTPRGSRFRKFIFGCADPSASESEYLTFYLRHYDDVLNSARELDCEDRILPICWESGDGWNKLCSFLGHEVPCLPFPHFNSSKLTAMREFE